MLLKEKKFLITGSTGFVGSNLTHHLVSMGIKPHIILRRESNIWRIRNILSNVVLHYVDMRDKDDIASLIEKVVPQIIFHTAVYGGFVFQKDDNKIIETNFLGSLNLINACKKVGCEVFINTGSSSEYGIKYKSMKEDDLLEPMTSYGVSKAATTLCGQAAAKRDGFPIITLRLFSPYGYYDDSARLISSTIISSLKGEKPKILSLRAVRDFIFIDDVINLYIKAVENAGKIKGEIINVGSGIQHSVGEVVNEIINLTGNKWKPEVDNSDNPRIEPEMWQADICKAKKLLDWKPEYTFQEGLKKTVEWFKINIMEYQS